MAYRTATEAPESALDPQSAFLTLARERFQQGRDADAIDREEAQDDNLFANSSDIEKSQWSREPYRARVEAYRPVLQWNRIPTFVAQVVNDGRQMKPAIKISPEKDATVPTAEFFQDRIRHLEYECNADIAYDTAREQQVTSGRAAIRVDTEWVPGTFRQRPCISPIEDQFSVVWDPSSVDYSRKTAEWVFITSLKSKAAYIRQFGEKAFKNWLAFETGTESGWMGLGENGDRYQVAEYWLKEYRKRTLVKFYTGAESWKDKLTDEQYQLFKSRGLIVQEREEDDCKIKQYIIDGAQILEETDWMGSSIPIVPVWGRTATVGGRLRTFSLIRNAKDPQRSVNMYVSNINELVAQMPKTPYLAAVGSIPANLETAWQTASNSPLGFLLYNSIDPATMLTLPRPERIMQEPPIQALTLALQQAIDGIKSAMGIFDASLGARSNETSGIAIERRKKSAEIVNYHFSDNESRSRKRIGEILVELIPLLDADEQELPTRSEDGKTTLVPIGKPYQHPKTGEEVIHNLTAGDYGVTVATGPSSDTKREATYERDAALIQAAPELMWVFGDLLFSADDTPGAQDRADRMKRAIEMKTPGLIQEQGNKQPIPPEVEQQVMALKQERDDYAAMAQKLHEEQQAKLPEIQSKEQIAAEDNAVKLKIAEEAERTKRMIALATLQSQEARLELEKTLEISAADQAQAHERELAEGDQAHEAAEADATREHASGEAEADRQQSSAEAEESRAHASGEASQDRKAAAKQTSMATRAKMLLAKMTGKKEKATK